MWGDDHHSVTSVMDYDGQFCMRARTQVRRTILDRISRTEFFTGKTLYRTHTSFTCLLISHSSPLGTSLLILLHHHDSRLSISLLVHDLGLSISLLVAPRKGSFFKASPNFTNSQSRQFQLTTNIQVTHKQHELKLLPTAIFKYPKRAFLTILH